MLCPEGVQLKNESITKEEEDTKCCRKNIKMPLEGSANTSLDVHSYKNPKTWKKSITNFFRNQLRSTKSNDGDTLSESKINFEDKEICPEQKWQSLGKVFRRQSFASNWQKPSNQQQGESSAENKRHSVRKVISSYFGKSQKCQNDSNEN